MWIPESAEQIETAAKAGELPETPAFDAKQELPAKGKTIDLATDVAAMATDGGVLLYGVAEDEHKRPTIPMPLTLAGAVERIGNIVNGCIDPVPYIEPLEFRTDEDDSKGYIALIVPQSPSAPHQVTVGGDYRFYGRGAQGNRILTAGDVERLHERRRRWEVDRWQRLNEVIAHAPHPAQEGVGYLHAFCQPVPPDRALWTGATAAGRDALLDALTSAARSITVGHGGSPALSSHYTRWTRQGASAWALEYSIAGRSGPEDYAACVLANDGRGQLFMGSAAELWSTTADSNVEPTFQINDHLIAGNLASFFAAMGAFFRVAGYVGHVDLGLAITGIRGGVTGTRTWIESAQRRIYSEDEAGFTAESYPRHERVLAAELQDPAKLTSKLLREFWDATAGEQFDPFELATREQPSQPEQG